MAHYDAPVYVERMEILILAGAAMLLAHLPLAIRLDRADAEGTNHDA